MNKLFIPIDNAIERFRNHLRAHDRTILSARFGDGKTYFLSQFMKNEDVEREYVFLTLYPVNYQVSENRDVFELIKYDLLIQMLVKGVIEPEFELTNAQALALCLQMKAPSLAEAMLPIIAELQLDERSAKVVAGLLTAKKMFTTVKRKVSEIKSTTRDNQILRFLKEIEQNPIVGQDVIMGIIHTGIERYRHEHNGKKVVLVIEDMDRMDPGHLFRIMNVFSAHIDNLYRFNDVFDIDLTANKFGIDKIVFVMHYENVRSIFAHFYGAQADFQGYIRKFCSSNHFEYSFTAEKELYVYKRLKEVTGLNDTVVKGMIVPDDISQHSVREVADAIEQTDVFVIKTMYVKDSDNKKVKLHTGVLKVIAVLRKLGIEDKEIKRRIKNLIEQEEHKDFGILKYLTPYMAELLNDGVYSHVRYKRNGDAPIVGVDSLLDDGTAEIGFYMDNHDDKERDSIISGFMDKLLEMVAI